MRRDAADSVEKLLKPKKVLSDALGKMNNDDGFARYSTVSGHKLKAVAT